MILLPRQILCSALVLGIIASSGCTSISPTTHSTNQINSELTQYLDTTNQQAVVLNNSPWGVNTQLIAEAPYFAASGHSCRVLQIELASGGSKQEIACKVKNQWQFTRQLTAQSNSY